MKKLLLLAAFVLLGNTIVSCENMQNNNDKDEYLASDDVIIPIKPPKKP
ncbi:hypothetical protein [Flavobacterium rivuli]|nr:hypothetical protein [Flavobacterium rivuli]